MFTYDECVAWAEATPGVSMGSGTHGDAATDPAGCYRIGNKVFYNDHASGGTCNAEVTDCALSTWDGSSFAFKTSGAQLSSSHPQYVNRAECQVYQQSVSSTYDWEWQSYNLYTAGCFRKNKKWDNSAQYRVVFNSYGSSAAHCLSSDNHNKRGRCIIKNLGDCKHDVQCIRKAVPDVNICDTYTVQYAHGNFTENRTVIVTGDNCKYPPPLTNWSSTILLP